MKDSEHGFHFEHVKVSSVKVMYDPKMVLDFDGVLSDGDFINEDTIVGEPVLTNLGYDSIVYLRKLHRAKIKFVIFSCRNRHPEGVKLMKAWLKGKGLEDEIVWSIDFPVHKPYGFYIDDNCVQAKKYGLYFPPIKEILDWLKKKKNS